MKGAGELTAAGGATQSLVEAVSFALAAPRGAVWTIGGVDAAAMADALDALEPQNFARRAVIVNLQPVASVSGVIEQVLAALAEVARKLWPLWWGAVRFPQGRDSLTRAAAGVLARQAAREIFGVSAAWAEAAARRAADGRPPREDGGEPAYEIAQLQRVIGRDGLTLIADAGDSRRWPHGQALVRALEWTAERIDGAVVALFPELPANAAPFDRILFDARTIKAWERELSKTPAREATPAWLAPWRGLPHPMSDVEQRISHALAGDEELSPLFVFNKTIFTTRGGAPRVDLVWEPGKLVVEIDGFARHGNRHAFVQDRHRDYELILSGFTVLRLTNDEIDEDLEKAIEKIRDVVTFCRRRIEEG